jgi:hypothetical protein
LGTTSNNERSNYLIKDIFELFDIAGQNRNISCRDKRQWHTTDKIMLKEKPVQKGSMVKYLVYGTVNINHTDPLKPHGHYMNHQILH